MAIVTTTQSSDSNIFIGEVQVGTFHTDTDQNGRVNASFNVTDPATFYASTEAATNLHALVDAALAQAKSNITPAQ